MLVLGIDPGVTTGVALYDTEKGVTFAEDTGDPTRLLSVLATCLGRVRDLVVVIESYVGAGPRTAEAVQTLKILGFVEFLCQSWGIRIVQQAPQKRKHQVAQAAKLLPQGPHHAKDALAHVLAFLGIDPIR